MCACVCLSIYMFIVHDIHVINGRWIGLKLTADWVEVNGIGGLRGELHSAYGPGIVFPTCDREATTSTCGPLPQVTQKPTVQPGDNCIDVNSKKYIKTNDMRQANDNNNGWASTDADDFNPPATYVSRRHIFGGFTFRNGKHPKLDIEMAAIIFHGRKIGC